MTATNSPMKEHLPPLQAVIDRTIDKYTGMKEYKRPDRHTHRKKLPTHCTGSNFSLQSQALQDSGRGHGL